MPSVFISHSSKDARTAERLAKDLRAHRHSVWLDSWRIKVGQCIVREIENGIEAADFVIVLLSNQAVESQWVDREWKAAYWDEVNDDSIIVLPACIEKCRIPKLLQTKKYAAIHESYDRGLTEILDAIQHYDSTRLNSDFFHAIERVRAELTFVSDEFAEVRHSHWDSFGETVASLPRAERQFVQKRNTQQYLDEYGLTVSQLKQQLRNLRVYDGNVDDELGEDVFAAISRFQRNHNLRHVDGVFGPLTYCEMERVARSITTW